MKPACALPALALPLPAFALIALVPLLLGAAPEPKAVNLKAANLGNPAEETFHIVKAGETLGGIAQSAVVPRSLIIEANGLKPPYIVREGQRLVIPRDRRHTVIAGETGMAGETGFAIAYQYGVSWPAIAMANGLDPQQPLKAGSRLVIPVISNLPDAVPGPPAAARPAGKTAPAPSFSMPPFSMRQVIPRFAWPAPGKVLRGFNPASGAHPGLDIGGSEGSAVRAVAVGTVLYAGNEATKYGNLVVIDHGKGWHTAYAKLQKVTVKKGEKVRAGERIGLLGHTGETSRTELHFEVRRNNQPIDPERVLPERD